MCQNCYLAKYYVKRKAKLAEKNKKEEAKEPNKRQKLDDPQ
jgi:hypothetical protein